MWLKMKIYGFPVIQISVYSFIAPHLRSVTLAQSDPLNIFLLLFFKAATNALYDGVRVHSLYMTIYRTNLSRYNVNVNGDRVVFSVSYAGF